LIVRGKAFLTFQANILKTQSIAWADDKFANAFLAIAVLQNEKTKYKKVFLYIKPTIKLPFQH